MPKVIRMTKEEWQQKGTRLFGTNKMDWEFVCPGCGHVQKVKDFFDYRKQGAQPDAAARECIGRYSGGKSWADTRHADLVKNHGPCDYAAYGLLNICPVLVIVEEGKETPCFAFNEGEHTASLSQ